MYARCAHSSGSFGDTLVARSPPRCVSGFDHGPPLIAVRNAEYVVLRARIWLTVSIGSNGLTSLPRSYRRVISWCES